MLNYFYRYFVLTILFLPVLSHAQRLTAPIHLPSHKDSLTVYKLPYMNVSDSGKNCVWDFSGISVDSAEMIAMNYYTYSKDTLFFGLHRENINFHYHYAHDTLWLDARQNTFSYINFIPSLPVLQFPYSYGDSIKADFIGIGQYCHFLPLSTEGKYVTKAVSEGRLLLPEIVIDSVLCVYSQILYHETEQKANTVKEEHFQWYATYSRYPLLETVYIQTVNGRDSISAGWTYYFPCEQDNISVKTEEQPDSVMRDSGILVTDVTYLPNPVYADLRINYSLVRPAHVYVSLHYNGGVTVYQTPVREEKDGEHTMPVNMAGLPIGTYVIYIHADNTIVSGNIIKL